MTEDIIAQLATAPGEAALAVIRVSGPGTHELMRRLFAPRSGRPPEPRVATVGRLSADGSRADIDDAVVVLYDAGASYTGEEMAEVTCHGGRVVVRNALAAICEAGARPASPGEFTKRAFQNGKLDLAQAEAVCQLIRARGDAAARASLRQLRGELSDAVGRVRDQLVALAAEVEASLDFPEEDTSSIGPHEVAAGCRPALEALYELLAHAPVGRAVRDGVMVALVGRPNTGKSSLLNQLLGRDRAIVTIVPGTTRDTLEEWTEIAGVPVRLVDTAGLRESPDEVERMGVERAERALGDCDLAVAVFDGSQDLQEEDELVIGQLSARDGPWIACVNKADLPAKLDLRDALPARCPPLRQVSTCALSSAGVEPVADALASVLASGDVAAEDVLLTSERHADCIRRAAAAIERALAGAVAGAAVDALALDVRESAEQLDSLLGRATTEDVIETIFAQFCLGK